MKPREVAQTPMSAPAERRTLERLIEEGRLGLAFQPIVDLSAGEIAGLECLTRPAPDSGVANPGELFALAERHGMLWPLEEKTRGMCFEAAAKAPRGAMVFMNTSPSVFADERYAESVARALAAQDDLDAHRVVLEITERSDDGQIDGLLPQSRLVRESGFQVAIDDVGAGTSGLARIMTLRPQWLKLDRELVSDIDTNAYKQNLIDFFVQFARVSGVRLVAEGVERMEELLTLIDMGVGFGQGFLLGRPGAIDQELPASLSGMIVERAQAGEMKRFRRPAAETIAEIARPALVAQSATPAVEAARLLQEAPTALGVTVMDGRRHVGWCARQDALAAAKDERAHAPVSRLVRAPGLSLPSQMMVSEAIRAAAGREGADVLEPVLIADGPDVVGIVTLQDLMRASARLAEGGQRHDAPLTGLPGRVHCDARLADVIRRGLPADVAFIDVVGLSTFNDAFGSEVGDLLLRIIAGLVASAMDDVERGDSFFGHLGDDRFVMATIGEPVERHVRRLVEEYSRASARFLDVSRGDAATGGAPLDCGLRAVVIEAVSRRVGTVKHLYELAHRLRRGVGQPGDGRSRVIVDRRGAADSQRMAS